MRSAWLVLLLLVPGAQGALTMTLTGPAVPVVPDTLVDLRLGVAMDCTDIVGHTQEPGQPIPVLLAVRTSHPNIVVTGPLTLMLPTSGCATPGTAKASGSTVLKLGASRAVPGETDLKVTLTATVRGQASQPDLQATGSADFQAAFYGSLSAKVPNAIVTTHGHHASLKVDVDNLGNSQAMVNFDVVGEVPAGIKPTLPAPLVMQSPVRETAHTNRTFAVEVATSGSWREHIFTLRIIPVSTKDPALQGPEVKVNFLVRNGDLVLGMPSAGPLAIAVLLACALLVSRRRP